MSSGLHELENIGVELMTSDECVSGFEIVLPS